MSELLKKFGQEEDATANSYIASLTDFVKWTTTINLAAVVWIANTLSSSAQILQVSSIIALTSLIFSLLFAIIAIKRILDASSNEWDVSRILNSRALLRLTIASEIGDVSSDNLKLGELEKQLNATLGIRKKYRETAHFNQPATLHTALLAFGITAYAVGQLITVIVPVWPF